MDDEVISSTPELDGKLPYINQCTEMGCYHCIECGHPTILPHDDKCSWREDGGE